MPEYGSGPWLEAVQRELNNDQEVASAGKTLTADFQYVVEADDALDRGIECGWRIDGGRCTEVWEGLRDADFVMVGPYSVFKRINTGEVNANEAMVSGDLQVQGNQEALMRHFPAVGAMQAALERMSKEGTTTWPA